MDVFQVETLEDFIRYVRFLASGVASTSTRSLEEYLRALWSLLLQYPQDGKITYLRFAGALDQAFLVDPLPFDEAWLQYTAPPDMIRTRPNVALRQEKNSVFAVFERMICYQIADLHRMKEAGMLDKSPNILYLGLQSPTGHSWYNFEPASFLECATAGFSDNDVEVDAHWGVFAGLLWLGQVYE